MTWIVKNTLKATLRFAGLDLTIRAGDSHDLDTAPGRASAESNNQVIVAFEEGYLENVYKEPAPQPVTAAPSAVPAALVEPGVSKEEFASGLESFKQSLLSELRTHLESGEAKQEKGERLDEVRAAISEDMQELVGELKLVRERFSAVKGRIKEDSNLSDAEVKARLAFLDEQERELIKNFQSVGRQVESEGGDVMDKADLLANL